MSIIFIFIWIRHIKKSQWFSFHFSFLSFVLRYKLTQTLEYDPTRVFKLDARSNRRHIFCAWRRGRWISKTFVPPCARAERERREHWASFTSWRHVWKQRGGPAVPEEARLGRPLLPLGGTCGFQPCWFPEERKTGTDWKFPPPHSPRLEPPRVASLFSRSARRNRNVRATENDICDAGDCGPSQSSNRTAMRSERFTVARGP